MNFKGIVLILTVVFLWPSILLTKERVYEEKTGADVVTHRFNMETTDMGYTIFLTTETKEGNVTQEFFLDKKLATVSWNYDDPKAKTKVHAARKDKKITLSGSDRGKGIEKTFAVDELAWNQLFNLGLEQFALNKEDTVKFWAIGVKGPGNMKITRFKVKKKSKEPILLTVGNQKMPAVYMTISLTGFLSMFWTGEYWFRSTDGVFLRYKGKNKPGAPVSFMQLVTEK